MFFNRPKGLIEEIKNGNRFFVEKVKDTVYLYITTVDFAMKAPPMWLQNLAPAPYDYELDRMNKGKPTRLPARHCKNVNGDKSAYKYSFRWVGNLLFVYGDGKIVAVVTNPFEQPQLYHVNIIGETRYGIEMPQQMLDAVSRM